MKLGTMGLIPVLLTAATLAHALAAAAGIFSWHALAADSIPPTDSWHDVKAYGACGDGECDDTAEIQAALDAGAGGTVRIPGGTYMIDCDAPNLEGASGGVAPRSLTRVECGEGAVLKCKPSSSAWGHVIRLYETHGVTVSGCAIDGNRAAWSDPGPPSEFGFGISVYGSTATRIENTIVENCWGDGLYFTDSFADDSPASNVGVIVDNVISHNNRRQGMSILDADEMQVATSRFSGSNGTAPEAGVDIEPEATSSIGTIVFTSCSFEDNGGSGLNINMTLLSGSFTSITVAYSRASGNTVSGISVVNSTGGPVLLVGNVLTANGPTASGGGITVDGSSDVTVRGNTITDNEVDGVLINNNSSDIVVSDNRICGNELSGVRVVNSTEVSVNGNDVHLNQEQGIQFIAAPDSSMTGNDIRSGRSRGIGEE